MEQSATGLPFDDIRNLIKSFPGPDEEAAAKARAREPNLTKPAGSLGRLENIAEWLATWQGRHPGKVQTPFVAIFAGNHGVVERGVSAFPAEVTQQMVFNFAAGGAAINQMCASADAGLKVFDLALDIPTKDICVEAAMTERDCAGTIAYGMESVAEGGDLLCIGEMGIGNTTIASAMGCALFGGDPADWVGPGTGVDDAGQKRKADVIQMALQTHGDHLGDPLEVLARLGGRELAGMVGAIIAARYQRIPVLIDGFVASAAAAVIFAVRPDGLDHCLFAHRSAEPAHDKMLSSMGKIPLLDLGMRLGEGTGAALAIHIVRTAAVTHAGMATFEEATVSNKS